MKKEKDGRPGDGTTGQQKVVGKKTGKKST